jgi:hypothetical protein
MKLIISHISGFVRDYELEGDFAVRYRSGRNFPRRQVGWMPLPVGFLKSS